MRTLVPSVRSPPGTRQEMRATTATATPTAMPSSRAIRSIEGFVFVMACGSGGAAAPHERGAAASRPDQGGRSSSLLVVRFPDERMRAGGQRAAAAVRVVVVRQSGLDLVDHGVVR